ncbi:MAG: 50S ribosomal protein L21 [Azospirillum sp.]|nr:50S ribosomal protein L21 [Azospirillum sp.]
MFAVIRTGGKQYKVASGDTIRVERLAVDPGAVIELDEVLMVANGGETTVGTPLVGGASVSAEVLAQARGPKIIIFKKKRRQNYRRKNGHRQDLTVLKITTINGVGAPATAAAESAPAMETGSSDHGA